MADEFKLADKVRLKSGGPPMMVLGASSETGHVQCTWFEDKRKKVSDFPPEILEAAVDVGEIVVRWGTAPTLEETVSEIGKILQEPH